MYVYNNLEHTSYTSIDDVVDGTSLRGPRPVYSRLGRSGRLGRLRSFLNIPTPAPAPHSIPAYDVQGIIIGNLTVTP